MARNRDTFGSYDTGAALPSRWTALDSTNATFTVATDAGSEGGQVLEIAKSGAGRGRITFNPVTSATEQDVLMEFEVDATGRAPGLIINASGGSGVEVEYLLEVSGTALTIWEAAGSGYASRSTNASALGSALTSGTVYAMRLRRQGNIIYGRIWIPASADEPAAWDVSYTDSGSPRSAGAVGISYPTTAGTLTVHYFSAGTGGDCGCVLADEDMPLRGIYVTSETDGSVTVYDEDDASINAVVAILGGTSISNLRGITCHNRDREVYAVARQRDDVVRMNRFGRNQTDVVTTLTDPYGVAIDEATDTLFISDRGATTVSSTPVHAISLTTIENPGASDFAAYLFWDAVNDKLWRASVSGIYSADADGTNDTDYDDLSEELQAITDGTTVMASDYTATGGIYTKPVASPGDSWTAVDTTSPIEGITLNTAADACWGIDNSNGEIIKWSSFPAASANRSTFASKAGVRAVCYFDFTEEAYPEDALLVANYGLESDGSDDVNSLDLTENNAPTFATGKVSNGAELEASSSQSLTLANASAGLLKPGLDSISAACWFKIESTPGGNVPVMGMGWSTGAGLDPGWTFMLNTSRQLEWRFTDGSTHVSRTRSAATPTGEWHWAGASWDRHGNAVLAYDGVVEETVSITAYVNTDVVPTEDFKVGGEFNATNYYDGMIDEARVWRRSLSPANLLRDYNAGAGRALSAFQTTGYPQIARQASAFSNNASATDLSVTAPDGVTATELLLLITSFDGGPGTIGSPTFDGGANDTTSAGFATEISDNSSSPSYALYSKTAVSADADQSTNGDGYNVGWSSIQGAAQTLLRITGHDGIDAISARLAGSGVTDPVSPGVTTTVANCLILDVMMVDDSAGGNLDVTAPDHSAVILNEYHAVPGATGGIVLSVAARHQATAGDTGAARWTLGSGRAYVSYTVAIAPEATGGTVSGSLTQGTATAGGVVDVLVQASGTLTQGASTLTGEAAVTVQASGSLTQGASTLAGETDVIVSASGSLTQGASTATGTIGTPTAEASGSLTQGAATLSAEASVLVQLSGTLTQGVSTLTGAATVTVSVSGSLTQGGQVLSGSIADPNNQIADIELSAAPLFGIALTASPKFNIALSAEPKVE